MRPKTLAKITAFGMLALALMLICVVMVTCPSATVILTSLAGILAIGSVKPTARCGSAIIMSSSLADHSARAAVGTHKAPIGGLVDYIEIMVYPVMTTGINTTPHGGLIEIVNDKLKWDPFEFYTQNPKLLTTTGTRLKPMRIPCKKNLPNDSTITVYYTAHNAATDVVSVTFHWIFGRSSGIQTFSKAGKGTATTFTALTWTRDHVTISNIPNGGRAVLALAAFAGTPETIVCEGGAVSLRATGADWEPTQFTTESVSGITTMAGEVHPNGLVLDHPLPSGCNVVADVKVIDDQSQLLLLTIVWEG